MNVSSLVANIAFQPGPLVAAAGDDAAAGFLAGLMVYLAVVFVIFVISVIGMWKVFEKAGQPGWAAIIPIYNIYILNNEIAKTEATWFIVYVVGIFICGPAALLALIIINLEVAKKFGMGGGYGIGLSFLPFIFWPMLGFGSAQYQGRGRRRSDDYDDEDEDEDEDDRPRKKKKGGDDW